MTDTDLKFNLAISPWCKRYEIRSALPTGLYGEDARKAVSTACNMFLELVQRYLVNFDSETAVFKIDRYVGNGRRRDFAYLISRDYMAPFRFASPIIASDGEVKLAFIVFGDATEDVKWYKEYNCNKSNLPWYQDYKNFAPKDDIECLKLNLGLLKVMHRMLVKMQAHDDANVTYYKLYRNRYETLRFVLKNIFAEYGIFDDFLFKILFKDIRLPRTTAEKILNTSAHDPFTALGIEELKAEIEQLKVDHEKVMDGFIDEECRLRQAIDAKRNAEIEEFEKKKKALEAQIKMLHQK